MSRRLRDPRLLDDFQRLVDILQRGHDTSSTLIVDGKPLAVSEFTGDPEAVTGWGAGRHAKGYKLHALIDGTRRLLAWEVRPMKDSEQAVACELVTRASYRGVLAPDATLLGDANYDSRHLYAAAEQAGIRLFAQRRLPGRGLAKGKSHHPHRLLAIAALESNPHALIEFQIRRAAIERFFGSMATVGGGLHALPAWARRLHRVRAWVGAKLTLIVARKHLQTKLAA